MTGFLHCCLRFQAPWNLLALNHTAHIGPQSAKCMSTHVRVCAQVEWKLARFTWRPRLLDFAKALDPVVVQAATQAALQKLLAQPAKAAAAAASGAGAGSSSSAGSGHKGGSGAKAGSGGGGGQGGEGPQQQPQAQQQAALQVPEDGALEAALAELTVLKVRLGCWVLWVGVCWKAWGSSTCGQLGRTEVRLRPDMLPCLPHLRLVCATTIDTTLTWHTRRVWGQRRRLQSWLLPQQQRGQAGQLPLCSHCPT